MRNVLGVLTVLLLAGAGPGAAREKIPIYIGYCYYRPTASSTTDAFGHAWPQPTLGRLETKRSDLWKMTYDLASFRSNDGNEAGLYALTFGLQRGLGSLAIRTKPVQPYVAIRTGPYYGKVKSHALGFSESRIGLNINAAVGVLIDKRYFLEGRYDHFGRVGGFDLDGFSISAGVKVLSL